MTDVCLDAYYIYRNIIAQLEEKNRNLSMQNERLQEENMRLRQISKRAWA